MKIIKLILKGYKPLVLNNIYNFEYTPSLMYQLILGTNGSGKSSVLAEINPMPGVAANYIKGGRKEVHLEHKGVVYELISEFKSGNKHTFKKGDDFLQEGGTQSVQKELVKQEFGLTQDIQDLLTGLVKFTSMSPNKRRDWLTTLCETDYTYALKVHSTLKSRLRDTQGALKHVHQRITGETNKLLSLDAGDELEERYKQLYAELDVLFQERDTNLRDQSYYSQEANRLLTLVENLSATILKNPTPYVPNGKSYQSLGDIDADVQQIQTDLSVNTSIRERISQELHELERLLEGIVSNGVEDIDGLKRRLEERKKEHQQQLQSVETYRVDYRPSDALSAYHQAYEALSEILYHMPDNSDRRFNKERLSETRKRLSECTVEHNKLLNRRSRVESQIEHHHMAKHTDCPKCGHRWVPGRTDNDVTNLQDQLKGLVQEVTTVESEIHNLRTYIEEAESYMYQYRGIRELNQQYAVLKPLWDEMLEQKAFSENTRAWIPKLAVFQRDAERWVAIERLDKECQELTALIEGSGKQGDTNGFANRKDVLNQQLEEVTQSLETLSKELQSLQQYRRQIARQLSAYEQLQVAMAELEGIRDTLLRAYRNDEIKTVTQSHQNTLAELQRKRTEKQTLQGVVSDLETSKGKLEGDQAILDAIVKTLSPTDGLIAEQLTGFIEGFVTHINQLIDGIWTYDLTVCPCGLDEGDLDYRFPLEVKGESNPVFDIVKGSTAQVEVINLAFKLVAMSYLQLEEYPLYLDEVGASFDEQHRINVMNVLKTLVDTGSNTQMFMISHYASQYGSFPQAETLVLDSANIAVPGEYNKHVVME